MAAGEWAKYEWLDAPESGDDLMAGCLGVATGLDEAAVRRVLGAADAPLRDATVAEAWQLSESDFGNDVVQIAARGDAVVTFEPNGRRGVERDLAVALSAHGR